MTTHSVGIRRCRASKSRNSCSISSNGIASPNWERAQKADIGAHGLWSISRGLARGLSDTNEHMRMMDATDAPRRNDFDGLGNLSLAALEEFTNWFLNICLDQITFMSELFDFQTLRKRLEVYVGQQPKLASETSKLLVETLQRGEIAGGDVAAILGLPERSARRILSEAIDDGILASETPKGPVSLRFPTRTLETLFPKLS